jgi:hypothetical protein
MGSEGYDGFTRVYTIIDIGVFFTHTNDLQPAEGNG